MARFVARRLAFLVGTLLFTLLVVFAASQLVPGDVARVALGREASDVAVQRMRAELGFDRPLPVQYLTSLVRFASGDWGESHSTRSDILQTVMGRFGNSLRLAAIMLVVVVPLAVGLGLLAGLKQNRMTDTVISVGSLSMVSMPEFVTALILIQVFAHGLGWFPASSELRSGTPFWQALPQLILPAVTATLVLLAYIARLTRAGVIEELRKSYVRTAVLKGLSSRRVVVKHVLRNALLPTATVVAISFGWLTGGIIVIENVFNYPGVGRLRVFAIDNRDIPLMQAITMVGVVLANPRRGSPLLRR